MKEKEVYEEYCYKMLSKLVDGFSYMKKSESPDYISENRTLEIVRPICTNAGEYEAFLNQNYCRSFSEISKEDLARYGFLGETRPLDNKNVFRMYSGKEYGSIYFYRSNNSGELILCFSIGGTSDLRHVDTIKDSIIKKTKKLNKNYKILEVNTLLLRIERFLNFRLIGCEIIEKEMDYCYRMAYEAYAETKGLDHHFHFVFFLYNDVLISLDTNTWNKKYKLISIEVSNEVIKGLIPTAIE